MSTVVSLKHRVAKRMAWLDRAIEWLRDEAAERDDPRGSRLPPRAGLHATGGGSPRAGVHTLTTGTHQTHA